MKEEESEEMVEKVSKRSVEQYGAIKWLRKKKLKEQV